MSKRSSLTFLTLALGACAAPGFDGPRGGEEEAAHVESVAAAVATIDIPQLLKHTVGSGTGAPVSYAVSLPQPDGPRRIVAVNGCTESQIRGLFGLWSSAFMESEDPAFDGPLPTMTCPDGIASDAPVYVEALTRGLSYLQSAASDGVRGPTYFVLPNRCLALTSHFQVVNRARRGAPTSGGESWSLPPGADAIRFSCASETPTTPYAGWRLRWVEGSLSEGSREFFRLERGTVSLLVDSVDGVSVNDMYWTDFFDGVGTRFPTALAKIATSFGIPPEFVGKEALSLGGDERELTAQPLLDMCIDRCTSSGWVPAHRRIVDGVLACVAGSMDALGACPSQQRPVVQEQRLLDGSLRHHVSIGGFDLGLPEACLDTVGWDRRLGTTTEPATSTWMASMAAAYDARTASTQAPGLELTCAKDPAPCKLTVASGTDLSTVVLGTLATRTCKRTDTVVEVSLPAAARLDGRPFAVSASTLPTALRTVRLLGALGGTTVSVQQPGCGAGGGEACTAPVAAISVDGDLTVELARLKLLAVRGGSGATVPPSVARIGIAAAGGAGAALALRLRDVHIGDVASGPFYQGITMNGGSLALYGSDVRAYTQGIRVTRGNVSIVGATGSTSEVVSLARSEVPYTGLPDLAKNSSLAGNVGNFPALTLAISTQAFIADTTISGPLQVNWSNDRLDYSERGIWSVNTTFTNGSEFFANTSVMLSASGRGDLFFRRSTVSHVAKVLDCRSTPWPTSPDLLPKVTFSIPTFSEITYELKRNYCSFESPITPGPVPSSFSSTTLDLAEEEAL